MIDFSEPADLRLCHEVNPALWRVFCKLSKRNPECISYYWTEDDVCRYIDEYIDKHLSALPGSRRLCPA